MGIASRIKSSLKSFAIISSAAIVVFGTSGIMSVAKADIAGSDFNPGFIISDTNFYNQYTLSSVAIQAWLNAQVPVCDTNGTQSSGHWNAAQNRYYTRAEWGVVNNVPTPFTCLKDYQMDTPAVAANAYCSALGASHQTAAQIIANVSYSCQVNPEVLIVLLQKEQGLVTDDWPWPYQYQAATGYGCPDTGSCDADYYGLFNQLYNAAWQFQSYKANPTNFSYRAGRSQNIAYSPTSACGGASVYIQNAATAGLYDYTPYQPDQAALNNLYGTGDACSSYGNRNFWRTYYNWFGNPTGNCQSDPTNNQVMRLYDPKTFAHYYTSDFCEINNLTKQNGYILEGNAFTTTVSTTPGAVPIYRLYNGRTGLHFYTTSQSDISQAVSGAGYILEGVSFYMEPATATDAIPVYRLYNPKTFIHLWTTSQADISQAVSSAGYVLEGPAFYTH